MQLIAFNSRPMSLLNDAAAIVPYPKKLGITHLYLSPFLRRVGAHGYDIPPSEAVLPANVG